jgi:hypothetical protein
MPHNQPESSPSSQAIQPLSILWQRKWSQLKEYNELLLQCHIRVFKTYFAMPNSSMILGTDTSFSIFSAILLYPQYSK